MRHDEICMFCGAPNTRDAEYCRICDTKLSEAKQKAHRALVRFRRARDEMHAKRIILECFIKFSSLNMGLR